MASWGRLRELLARYNENKDAILYNIYKKGTDSKIDEAIEKGAKVVWMQLGLALRAEEGRTGEDPGREFPEDGGIAEAPGDGTAGDILFFAGLGATALVTVLVFAAISAYVSLYALRKEEKDLARQLKRATTEVMGIAVSDGRALWRRTLDEKVGRICAGPDERTVEVQTGRPAFVTGRKE